MSELIVYIDHSDIREGKLDDVKAAIHELAAFVETHEPQLLAYGFYLNEDETHIAVVAIHPDSESLETHMEIGGPEFRQFADLINLHTIEVFGRPSAKVLDQLHQKAAMLGEDGRVVVHDQAVGFVRLAAAMRDAPHLLDVRSRSAVPSSPAVFADLRL